MFHLSYINIHLQAQHLLSATVTTVVVGEIKGIPAGCGFGEGDCATWNSAINYTPLRRLCTAEAQFMSTMFTVLLFPLNIFRKIFYKVTQFSAYSNIGNTFLVDFTLCSSNDEDFSEGGQQCFSFDMASGPFFLFFLFSLYCIVCILVRGCVICLVYFAFLTALSSAGRCVSTLEIANIRI